MQTRGGRHTLHYWLVTRYLVPVLSTRSPMVPLCSVIREPSGLHCSVPSARHTGRARRPTTMPATADSAVRAAEASEPPLLAPPLSSSTSASAHASMSVLVAMKTGNTGSTGSWGRDDDVGVVDNGAGAEAEADGGVDAAAVPPGCDAAAALSLSSGSLHEQHGSTYS